MIESRGRLHPVEILDLERPRTSGLSRQVAAAVRAGPRARRRATCSSSCPASAEIQRTRRGARRLAAERASPSFRSTATCPAERQDAVLRPLDRRKVVLATNVAETSVTVDGVTAVVDSGLARRLRFDPGDRPRPPGARARSSRASADQRAGRAGRQAPGLCLRLWPAWEHADAPGARDARDRRGSTSPAPALQLLAWGETDLAAFDWFEAPDPAALAAATPPAPPARRHGRPRRHRARGPLMARLPVHPRLARLLVEGHRARRIRARPPCSPRSSPSAIPFPGATLRRGAGPRRSSRSDLLDRLDALEAFERRDRAESRV